MSRKFVFFHVASHFVCNVNQNLQCQNKKKTSNFITYNKGRWECSSCEDRKMLTSQRRYARDSKRKSAKSSVFIANEEHCERWCGIVDSANIAVNLKGFSWDLRKWWI